MILAATAWMLTGVNRWLVAWLFGAETAGYFTLASNIGAVLPAIPGMIMLQYFLPEWFTVVINSPGSQRKLLRDVDRVALIYTVLGLSVAVAVHAAMPLLIGTLVSVRYAPAARFVLMTGCFVVSTTTGMFYHTMLIAAKQERACSMADLGGAVCLILGCIISAGLGLEWFKDWLMISPIVPWLVNRTLARRALLKPI